MARRHEEEQPQGDVVPLGSEQSHGASAGDSSPEDSESARRASLRSTLDNLPRLDPEPEDVPSSADATMSSDVTTVLSRAARQATPHEEPLARQGDTSGSLARLDEAKTTQSGTGPVGEAGHEETASSAAHPPVSALNIPEVGEEPEEVDWLSPKVAWDAEGQDWVTGALPAQEEPVADEPRERHEGPSHLRGAEKERPGGTGEVGDAGGGSFGTQVADERKQRLWATRKRVLLICAVCLAIVAVAVAGVFVAMHGTIDWWPMGSATDDRTGAKEKSFDAVTDTVVVRADDVERKIKVIGRLEAVDSAAIDAPASGKVTNLSVSEGSYVAEGEMLFSVVNDEVKRSVRTAESYVAASKRAVENAQRAIDNAVKAYSRAWEACNAKNDFSGFDEEGLNEAVAQAEAVLDEEEANLEVAERALEEARAEADKLVVRAPRSGTICGLNVRDGEKVNSAKASTKPLMEVADITRLKLSSELEAEDALFVREGQEATVTFEELPGTRLEATVSAVVEPKSERNAKGEALPYTVEVEITSDQPQVRPHMEAKVSILTDGVEGALLVPFSAVTSERDEDGETHEYVYVVTDVRTGQSERVEVSVLALSGDDAVITGGIEEGERVMVNASLVDDGS